jgi:hypothetical protein
MHARGVIGQSAPLEAEPTVLTLSSIKLVSGAEPVSVVQQVDAMVGPPRSAVPTA